MTIPDYISPIVAYRVWLWDASGLKSVCGEPWFPQRPLAAGCRASIRGATVGSAEAVNENHDVPQADCTCGVYATKSLDHLRKTGYSEYGIHGEVFLWGTVVEHELGWRAQFAYPKKFVLPLSMMPLSMGAAESRLRALAAYGCDIFVHDEEGTVPLWHSQCGYEAAGLGVLMQRCNAWYAHRAQERQIKRGDRIAVLGRGIAVVEQAGGNQVCAMLWNRDMVRIGRKAIVWDEQNMRWETGGRNDRADS